MRVGEFLDIFQTSVDARERLYEPIHIEALDLEPSENGSRRVDTVFELVWKDRRVRCLGHAKGRFTPRIVRSAVQQVREATDERGDQWHPVVLVPYLSDGVATELKRAGVSGLDLNGNYLVLTPDILAIRLDRPNQYPESRSIKKVYSNKSSLVGRFLLAQARSFEQVNEIHREILQRGGEISLSTVSKVLNRLAEELVIEKRRGDIRVLQPEKLLDGLREAYRPPRFGDTTKLKLPDASTGEVLTDVLGEDWMWSGETSAANYTATTPPAVSVAYTPTAIPIDKLEEYEDRRFHNCIVARTRENRVYFDRRGRWASPVETCLALSQMDKRERQLARAIRDNVILAEFEKDV